MADETGPGDPSPYLGRTVGAVRESIRAGKIPVVKFDRKTSRNLTYQEVTGKAGMRKKPRISRKCERGDLNPYGVTRWILSPVRLPVPPLSHALFYAVFRGLSIALLPQCSRFVARVQNLHARPEIFRVMMSIALCHGNVLMAEQLLHLVEVHPVLSEPRGEGVPKTVKVKIGDLGLCQRLIVGRPQASYGDREQRP